MDSSKVLKLRPDIKLVPLNLNHAPNIYRWMCDPVVANAIGLRRMPSLEKTESWITSTLQDDTMLAFGIFLGQEHVGALHFDHYDPYLASVRFAIVYIGEAHARGSGAGLTAYYLAFKEAFSRFSLNKIWTTVHERNFRALATNSRLGMKLEGILRDEFKLDGEYLNLLYLGLVKEDFEKIAVEFKDQD